MQDHLGELTVSIADSTSTDALLTAIADGDRTAVDELLARHRGYLRRVVDVRMDAALRPRVDPSDVVQETLAVASRRLDDFLARRPTSFRIWLRRKAIERLVDARRKHLALKRDARRDNSISDASSLAIARGLLRESVGHAAIRRELSEQVREAMTQLAEIDQEIILLRHAEGLTNVEAAEVLEVDPGAASKRYGRAIGRLSAELRKMGVQSL
jgi:RNA polymerase sigma-70 factor, ECF subfamily